MKDIFWKSILLLIVLILGATSIVQGNGNMEKGQEPATLTGTQGIMPTKETCTREGMDQCEYGCMMPNGLINLNCYEACIFSIC